MSPATLEKPRIIGYNMLMPTDGDTNDDGANWAYKGGDNPELVENTQIPQNNQSSAPVSWTASEFIDIQKGTGWHFLFFAGTALLGALIFFFTHDYIAPITMIVAAVIFVIITSKKPRELPYQVNDQGIQIGIKFYRYENFKSFDLAQEGGIKSISLMPLQRFMPEISIYFPPEQEKAIVGLLSTHLPHEERIEKAMDKVARKLRF